MNALQYILRPRIKTIVLMVGFGIFLGNSTILNAASLQATPEYQQAMQVLGQGNYEGAISALQPLLLLEPFVAGVKVEMGNIRKKQAEAEAAQANNHFLEAANNIFEGIMGGGLKGTEAAKALTDLAQLYSDKLNNPTRAIEIYNQILLQHPSFLAIDKIAFTLAQMYEKVNKSTEAAQHYRDFVVKYPYSTYFTAAQNRMKALSMGTNGAGAAIEIQENLVENAKTEQQGAKATMDLAAMHLKQGDTKKALEEYRKVAADAPTLEMAREAYQKIASLLDEKEKDYKGAAAALEEIVTKFPNEPGNDRNYYKLGRIYEENITNLKLRIRENQPMYKQGTENITKAIEYYDRITESTPESDVAADAYLRKGKLYEERLKDSAEASKQYKEFLRKFPEHPEAESIKEKLKTLEQ